MTVTNDSDDCGKLELQKAKDTRIAEFESHKRAIRLNKEKAEKTASKHKRELNQAQFDIRNEKYLLAMAEAKEKQAAILEVERQTAREIRIQRIALVKSLQNIEIEHNQQIQIESQLEHEILANRVDQNGESRFGFFKHFYFLKKLVKLKKRNGDRKKIAYISPPVKDNLVQIDSIVERIINAVDDQTKKVLESSAFIKADLFSLPEAQGDFKKFTQKINNRLRIIEKAVGTITTNNNIIAKRMQVLTRTASRNTKGSESWANPDKLSLTDEWGTIKKKPKSPYVLKKRGRIEVLFLNSMGGSMSRLSKGLMLNENVVSDCMVNAYSPRRHLVYPHETNVYGVFQHQEWRDYMEWAVGHYDIIQTTSIPLWPGVAECYDWLTETLGRRHIWRTTGFIHHYLLREDIISLDRYQHDLKTTKEPSPDRLLVDTFKVKGKHFLTDPNVVFYSSPEKGAYLKGKDNYWLPSIRDDAAYAPDQNYKIPTASQYVKIYVPHHENAVFKGLDKAIEILKSLQQDGYKIKIVTPENATDMWPDLRGFKEETEGTQKAGVYPVPNHLMPVLFSRVDLVIDQIVMGCYGNTGIEAMMSGKPVLGQQKFDEVVDCPVIEVTGDTLKSKIIGLMENRNTWKALGEAGREYALRMHSSEAVSKIAADTYRMILDEL